MADDEKKKGFRIVKAGDKKDRDLDETKAYLEKKEADLDTREKALAERGPSVAPARVEKKPLSSDERKLIEEGCKAYGIDEKYIFSAKIDVRTKEAVLVTAGGAKVRYAKNMAVDALDPVAVDGISRKKPRYLMGKKNSS
jgi:hypothetical protein